tara:strand:+ start:151 stop:582 length:432 start_codon:yes stop_codon:yes gene_type:complete
MKSRLEKVYSKLPNQKVNLKAHKVALGLIDNFAYDNLDGLQDEVSRLSYSVDEWFDEKYSEFLESYRPLRDVYFNNSEAFITKGDLDRDLDLLNEIKEKAEELGLSASEVYPDWQEHFDQISYVEDLQKRFEDQKRELSNWIN